MSGHIITGVADGVLELTISRPQQKNALSMAMYEALAEAIERVESEPGLRVLLITGSGDSFSAGNDLGDFLAADAFSDDAPVLRFLHALAGTDVPIVAAVNGLAVGVGVTLLFHCDFVFACETAVFSTPFVDLGLVPEAGSTLTMPAQMGYRQAARLLLLGERFSAAQMLAAGAITGVVPAEQLLVRARAVAGQLARKPKRALRASKRLLRPAAELQACVDREAEAFKRALGSPEAMEALAAFSERRAPDFSRFE